MCLVISRVCLIKVSGCLQHHHDVISSVFWALDTRIRPPKMAILLFSVHPLLDQSLLDLHPAPMTDLPSES